MSILVSENGARRSRAGRGGAAAAVIASLAVVVSALSPLSPASADTAPTNPSDARTPETVSSDSLPVPQLGDGLTDGKDDTKGSGVVWDQVVIGNTVYVGGSFQYARPAGAKAGSNVVERSNFLAYDLNTGALLDYAPTFNAQIRSLAASPDGTRLYVGGSFTEVNGSKRSRVAAFDVATGTLDPAFSTIPSSTVNDLSASDTTVYLAGVFTSVSGQTRQNFAAVDAGTGALQSWAPAPKTGTGATKTRGNTILVSPDGKKVIVGGVFASMNGSTNPGSGMAALDATTASTLPWKVNSTIKNGSDGSSIMDLTTDGTSVYGVGYQYEKGKGKNYFEGTFRASWADGTLQWMTDCHGDSYSVTAFRGAVYTASHAHYCSGIGAFPDNSTSVSSDSRHRALAFSQDATGVLSAYTSGTTYENFAGKPSPSLLDWYPDLGAGEFTGATQAAWDVTAAGDYVLYGGELTSVNGVKQRGLARFAVTSAAPNDDGPQLEGADMQPTATNRSGTWVRLDWPANYDRDNARLTYQVIRDGKTDAPVFETTVESRFWDRPTVSGSDGPLAPGSTHTYQIRVIDPFGNSKLGEPILFTATAENGAGLSSYDRVALQDQPSAYWSANEYKSLTMYDWVGTNNVKTSGTTRVTGAEQTSPLRGISFPGTAASQGVSATKVTSPTTFTVEAWFKTSTKSGGKIVGFEYDKSYDRHIYMDKAGKVTFGVHASGKARPITTKQALNDGKWHHVVGSLSASGVMEFFVDGVRVGERSDATNPSTYAGKWVIGGGHTWADSNATTSRYFAGTIDNVAVYDRAVTSDVVTRHFQAAQAPKPNVLPTASISSTVSDLAVSVDGAGSTDSDGTVVSYGWDFGDGATASGARSTHTYAKSGSYPVSLTVTDDRGGKSTTSKTVAVAAQPEPEPEPGSVVASDAFDRSIDAGWGAATVGGAWAQTGKGTTSVANGAGVLAVTAGQTRTSTLADVSSPRRTRWPRSRSPRLRRRRRSMCR